MRFNRPLLYAGTFLAAAGGVVVLADAGGIDTPTIADLVRLWPIVPIALGVALVARRTKLSLAAGMLGAVAPGLLLGSAFAIIPRFAGDCGVRGGPMPVASASDSFDGPASVVIETGCGRLNVTTAPGSEWAISASNTAGFAPTVDGDPQSLWISGGTHGWEALRAGRDAWDLTLPTSQVDDLSVRLNAARSTVALDGARIGTASVTANLSDIVIDATDAAIDDLSLILNMSSASIQLPSGRDLVGSIRVGGGEVQLCAPPDLGLSVSSRGFGRERTADGVDVSGDNYVSPNYDTAAYHADLEIRANFSTVTINPTGGCR